MIDKRELTEVFRERLAETIARSGENLTQFAKGCGVDRSAIAQFLDSRQVRLPRAEALRRIGETTGVSIDWLLGLSNARDGLQEVASSSAVELTYDADQSTLLDQWRSETAGGKIRLVPTNLPDMLSSPEFLEFELEVGRESSRFVEGEQLLGQLEQAGTDIEICMAEQVLIDLRNGARIWQNFSQDLRRNQLRLMAELTRQHYPGVRLHLYDGTRIFASPYTVFGATRAALYLGQSYLVVTGAQQIHALSRHFDNLIRQASVQPQDVSNWLDDLAA